MNVRRVGKVEEALVTEPTVQECLVLRRPAIDDQERLVAYVVSAEPPAEDRLLKHLAARLPGELLPDAFVGLSRLPLTADGRPDEEALCGLPVLESELTERWEADLASTLGAERVAVIPQRVWRRPGLLHLSDLLPERSSRGRSTATGIRPAPSPLEGSTVRSRSARRAECRGGVLRSASGSPQTAGEALRQAAQRAEQDDILYIPSDGGESRQSYGALLEDAQAVLAGLRKSGLRPGDKALLQLDRNGDLLGAFWGCVLGGIVPVIAAVPPTYTEPHRLADQFRGVWELLERPLVITSDRLRGQMRTAEGTAIEGLKLAVVEELRRHSPEVRQHQGRPDDPLFFALTSGSTSAPKCVVLTHRNVLSRAAGTNALCGHRADDVILSWLPFDHIGSISDWHLRCVLLGCKLVYAAKEYVISQPARWLELIDRHRVTHSWAPNFAYSLINDAVEGGGPGSWDLSCVEAFLTAGESVSPRVVRRFLELLASCGLKPSAIRPAFGMAEMGSGITYCCGTDQTPFKVQHVKRSSLDGTLVSALVAAPAEDVDAVGFVSVGPPIAGVALRIVDPEGSVVAEETIGHLQVKGEPVAEKYYGLLEAGDVLRADGWFETGDLGYLSGGELYVTGRAKESIVVNGANYYCGEIEEVVDSVEGVEPSFSAACAVRNAAGDSEALAVFFHTAIDDEDDLQELLKRIRRRVVRRVGVKPEYLIPVEREAIPKTGIGKRQRGRLVEQFEAGRFDEVLKRVDLLTGNENTLPDAFYRTCWRQKHVVNRRRLEAGECSLVFMDAAGLGAAVCAELQRHEQRCVRVEAGSHFEALGPGRYRVDPGEAEHYRRLVESLGTSGMLPAQIVHLGNFGVRGSEDMSPEDLRPAGMRGLGGLHLLVQAWADVPPAERPVRLLAVWSNTQTVAPGDKVAPQRCAAAALIRAVGRRAPWLECRGVDCPTDRFEARAAAIVDELADTSGEVEVAFREEARWVRRLERVDFREPAGGGFPFKPGGLYVVAGDLTGPVVELARYVLQRGARLLIATPGDDLAGLEGSDGVMRFEAADPQDLDAWRRAIGRAETKWECRLDGVIYSMARSPADAAAGLTDRMNEAIDESWALSRLLESRGGGVFLSLCPVDDVLDSPAGFSGAGVGDFLEGLCGYQRRKTSVEGFCYQTDTDARGSRMLNGILAGLYHGREQMLLGGREVPRTCEDFPYGAERLVAYVSADGDSSGAGLAGAEIRDRFGTAAACQLVMLDAMPLLENGEIDRACLAAGAGERSEERQATPQSDVECQVASIWREVLHLEDVGIHDNIFELGGNSLLLVQVHARLQATFGPRLSLVDMFRYPTVDAVAKFLGQGEEASAAGSPVGRGRERAGARKRARSSDRSRDVAVIGIACRFPGAASVGQFWRNLREGVESIAVHSEQEVLTAGVDPALAGAANYVRAGGVLENVEDFDAEFFGYTAREAELMDPQQRLMLECAWEALEDAGYDPRNSGGSVGVYASAVLNTYLLNHLYAGGVDREGGGSEVMTLSSMGGFQVMAASDKDYLPTRISYKLDLRGPSVNVQTACSSSLVAVHMAVESILGGQCETALAGGVSVSVPQKTGYLYEEGLLVSPDGHCRAFDAGAGGTVFGNGAGVVLLKRFENAVADGDRIYAVVKGSAVNNDGGGKVGFYAPSQEGQAAVVAEALAVAGVEPESVSYVEAHGTGTSLGDPIEIAGLTQAFRGQTDAKQFCAIGSVKTNVGHLQIASGIAGFIKAVLSLHHGELPESLHFEKPNPQIDFAGSPFFVNAACTPWARKDGPRRAGVNSLGIGGTNAHVILEEAPELAASVEGAPVDADERPVHLLALSAKTAAALRTLATEYAGALGLDRRASLADICFTAATGRSHFQNRLAVVAESIEEAGDALGAFLAGREVENLATGTAGDGPRPDQGPGREASTGVEIAPQRKSEWREMLHRLAIGYVQGAAVDFRALDGDSRRRRVGLPTYPFQRKRYWVERPDGLAGQSSSGRGRREREHPLLGRRVTSPALGGVLFESTLSATSFGLLGEHRFFGTPILPGACQLAMVLDAGRRVWKTSGCTLEDVAFVRALVVPDGHQRTVQLILDGDVASGASFQVVSREDEGPDEEPDGGDSWTVHATGRAVRAGSGRAAEVHFPPARRERFMAGCERRCSGAEFYETMRAHHAELGRSLAVIESAWVGDGEVLCRLRAPEKPARAEAYALDPVFLDACLQVAGGIHQYSTELTLMPTAIARFHFAGLSGGEAAWCHVRIRGAGKSAERHLTVDASLLDEAGRTIATLEGLRYEMVPREILLEIVGKGLTDWMYRPRWMAKPLLPGDGPRWEVASGRWLLLTDREGFGGKLRELLERQGEECVLVEPGECYRRLDSARYEVDPGEPEDFRRLIDATQGVARSFRGIVHLWSLDGCEKGENGRADLPVAGIAGCAGVIHLLQAVDEAGWTESPTLCLVTKGAQPVDDEPRRLQVEQSLLWGLGRTIGLEHPELKCRLVDLDPAAGLEQASAVLEELGAEDAEREIALRDQTRHVARLRRYRVEAAAGSFELREGTYLISGGTGALGLAVAGWLVDRGARHLVLVSRGGATTPEARRAVQTWRAAGIDVAVHEADVSRPEEVAGVLEAIGKQMPPLRGVVHAAGILDDGVLKRLSRARLERVTAAKVEGAWNLHLATCDHRLDFFVTFSSIASLLGSAGQGNYAAANAFLDALAHHRRAMDLPGLSINWGPWADAGMAAALSRTDRENLARRGLQPLDARAALLAMRALLEQPDARQVAVLRADWSKYAGALDGASTPFLQELTTGATGGSAEPQGELLARLERAPAGRRQAVLRTLVGELVGDLLGIDPDEAVDPDEGFYEQGMDSLSIMLLRNRLQNGLGVSLPATLAFKYTTIRSLADYLAEDVLAMDGPAPAAPRSESFPDADSGETLADALNELTPEELADRLAEKLASIQGAHDQS